MNYSDEQYDINRITGEFRDPVVELSFANIERKHMLRYVRYALLFAGISILAFSAYDHIYVKDEVHFLYAPIVRLCIFFTSVVVFLASGKTKDIHKEMTLLSVAELVFFFMYMLLMYVLGVQDLVGLSVVIMLIVLGVVDQQRGFKPCNRDCVSCAGPADDP